MDSRLHVEMGVLGCIILRPDILQDVAMLVRPDEFQGEANRMLFEHMMKIHDAGRRMDAVLLVDNLRRDGVYVKLGGAAFLGRVVAAALPLLLVWMALFHGVILNIANNSVK